MDFHILINSYLVQPTAEARRNVKNLVVASSQVNQSLGQAHRQTHICFLVRAATNCKIQQKLQFLQMFILEGDMNCIENWETLTSLPGVLPL